MSRALVIGHDTRAFLAVCRSLWRAGHEVHVVGCPPPASALQSRAIKQRHDALSDDDLLDMAASPEFDFVVPCHDAEALLLHRHRDRVTGCLALPPVAAFEIAFDKAAANASAQRLGIPVPEGRVVTDAEEVPDWPGPLVVKPVASAVAGLPHRLPVTRVPDAAAAGRLAAGLLFWGPVTVQRVVPGIGVGVEVLCHDGEVLTAMQHRRIHEPPHGGGSSLRETVPLDDSLLQATRALMAHLKWTGVAMVEFRVDEATGDWWFMEINGRPWGSLPLAIAAGMDFPAWWHDLLVVGRMDFPQTYRVGVRARNLRLDLGWTSANAAARHAVRHGSASAAQGAPPLGRLAATRDWLRGALPGNCSDTADWRDPMPHLAELAGVAAGVARVLKSRTSLRRSVATLAPDPVAPADTILMLCKGNICRSPFATAYANAAWPGVTVLGAGTYPVAGRPTPREGIVAARKDWGLDLSSHGSRIVDEDAVGLARQILVFDHENADQLVAAHPEARDKIRYLGAAAGGDPVIADPWLGDEATFAACYERIAAALDAVEHRGPRR